jgi:hypothetical protein
LILFNLLANRKMSTNNTNNILSTLNEQLLKNFVTVALPVLNAYLEKEHKVTLTSEIFAKLLQVELAPSSVPLSLKTELPLIPSSTPSAVSVPRTRSSKGTNTCKRIISRGKKKGEVCGKNCQGELCPAHSKSPKGPAKPKGKSKSKDEGSAPAGSGALGILNKLSNIHRENKNLTVKPFGDGTEYLLGHPTNAILAPTPNGTYRLVAIAAKHTEVGGVITVEERRPATSREKTQLEELDISVDGSGGGSIAPAPPGGALPSVSGVSGLGGLSALPPVSGLTLGSLTSLSGAPGGLGLGMPRLS